MSPTCWFQNSLHLKKQLFYLLIRLQKKEFWKTYPVTEKGILEDERKEIDRLPAYNAGNTGRFRVNVSPDHQFLVVLRENIYDKAKNETIALHRYDTDLNQVWTKTHAFSILSKNQTVNIPFVNNKGDLICKQQRRSVSH